MKRAGKLLDGLLSAGPESAAGRELRRVRELWPVLVGENLAQVSYVRNAEDGVLRVEALHSTAIQLLQLRSRGLRQRLRQDFPLLAVERVRAVQVGSLSREMDRVVARVKPAVRVVQVQEQQGIKHSKPEQFRALLRKLRESSETDNQQS